MVPPFPRELLARPALDAARALLGARLVRDPDGPPARAIRPEGARRVGRIVEVEAYLGEDDRASHARFGPTDRNRVMYGPPGVAYVYLVYGMYDCLNVVCEPAGRPAAILVRAVEPLDGLEAMRRARALHARRAHPRWDEARLAAEAARLARLTPERVASGPGALAAAFSIDRAATGLDLCDAGSPLRLEVGAAPAPASVHASARIGVAYAGEPWASVPWRFVLAGSPAVSGRRTRG